VLIVHVFALDTTRDAVNAYNNYVIN